MKNVFHVGILNLANLSQRPLTNYSLEGSGLSVSLHPNEWRQIAKLSGSVFQLSNPNAKFYKAKKSKKVLKWCEDHKFIKKMVKYQAVITDEEGKELLMEFDTIEQAQYESEEVKEFLGYVFDVKGIEYWHSFCSAPLNNSFAESYAPLFYAEAQGFDGVWWNEILDPNNYSAPRGVIFQSKLKNWSILPFQQAA